MKQAIQNLRKWGFDTRRYTNHEAYQQMAKFGYEWRSGRWVQCVKYRRGLYKARVLGRNYIGRSVSVTAATLYRFLKEKGYSFVGDEWKKTPKPQPIKAKPIATKPAARHAAKPKQMDPNPEHMSEEQLRQFILDNAGQVSARK
jgi:hypothetical protein